MRLATVACGTATPAARPFRHRLRARGSGVGSRRITHGNGTRSDEFRRIQSFHGALSRPAAAVPEVVELFRCSAPWETEAFSSEVDAGSYEETCQSKKVVRNRELRFDNLWPRVARAAPIHPAVRRTRMYSTVA